MFKVNSVEPGNPGRVKTVIRLYRSALRVVKTDLDLGCCICLTVL